MACPSDSKSLLHSPKFGNIWVSVYAYIIHVDLLGSFRTCRCAPKLGASITKSCSALHWFFTKGENFVLQFLHVKSGDLLVLPHVRALLKSHQAKSLIQKAAWRQMAWWWRIDALPSIPTTSTGWFRSRTSANPFRRKFQTKHAATPPPPSSSGCAAYPASTMWMVLKK